MSLNTTIEVVGLKQTINGLGKIDKQLQKDFKADATAIAQPAINAGKAAYTRVPISNFANDWTQKKTADGLKVLALTKHKAASRCVLTHGATRSA